MMFRDQVGVLASWFKGWNECEQTVALLSLLKRVSRTQARFLQLCLEHSLAECTELQVLEGEANNPGRTAGCSDTDNHYTFRRDMMMHLQALTDYSHNFEAFWSYYEGNKLINNTFSLHFGKLTLNLYLLYDLVKDISHCWALAATVKEDDRDVFPLSCL